MSPDLAGNRPIRAWPVEPRPALLADRSLHRAGEESVDGRTAEVRADAAVPDGERAAEHLEAYVRDLPLGRGPAVGQRPRREVTDPLIWART